VAARDRANDPYEEVILLMHLRTVMWKRVEGRGRWAIRFRGTGHVKFGIVASGTCTLTGVGAPRELAQGDFLLLAAPPEFTFSGAGGTVAADGDAVPPGVSDTVITLGTGAGEPARLLCGHVELATANADLLLGLMPDVIHLRAGDHAAERTAQLIDLLKDEALAGRPGGGLVQERLAEVLLIEALRSRQPRASTTQSGLLRGLGDPQIAAALAAVHADIRRPWTVAELADTAHLSRSTFAQRFVELVGTAPIDYLVAWRMAVAKDALARGATATQVAVAVGYGSSSAFSSAFHRHVGIRPGQFARTDGRRHLAPPRSSVMSHAQITPDSDRPVEYELNR
jgi:AraC-like DNA-binding protein